MGLANVKEDGVSVSEWQDPSCLLQKQGWFQPFCQGQRGEGTYPLIWKSHFHAAELQKYLHTCPKTFMVALFVAVNSFPTNWNVD